MAEQSPLSSRNTSSNDGEDVLSSISRQTSGSKETKSSEQKPEVQKLIKLVHSSDIQAANESTSALREMLLNGDAALLAGLFNHYAASNSPKLLDIVTTVRQPLDKILLDHLAESWRTKPHACLSLVCQLILKQTPWLYKLCQHPCFPQLIKTVKLRSDDLPFCVGAALVFASLLLSTAPLIGPYLADIFSNFLFLTSVLHKVTSQPGQQTSVGVLHLRTALHVYFQRFYGLYPCHFLTFLRQHFAGPQTTSENRQLFLETIRPMLDFVRLHHFLLTTNKDGELAKDRWVRKETHDILLECNQILLDPYETGDDISEKGHTRSMSSASLMRRLVASPRSVTSSAWSSCKPTPNKFNGTSGTERKLALSSITLPPAAAAKSALASASAIAADSQMPCWSPSDTIGLRTPPDDEVSDECFDGTTGFRLKFAPSKLGESSRRKTSMAAGPESPAPHMRSFRTSSWGTDARQKFLNERAQRQRQQKAAAEPSQTKSRRSFGQTFAKLFHRPVLGIGQSSSSVPPSPSHRTKPQTQTFNFETSEIRATASQYGCESGLTQQTELAEEAEETVNASRAPSLASSKRPSLSEPALCLPKQLQPEQPEQQQRENDDGGEEALNARRLSTILKILSKENDENLLEDAEVQQLMGADKQQAGAVKRQSFSSSRTSSALLRTRNNSSATVSNAAAQGVLSRHSSLLDTQALVGNSRASLSPVGLRRQSIDSNRDKSARSSCKPGFSVGECDEPEQQSKPDGSELDMQLQQQKQQLQQLQQQKQQQLNEPPRLSSSHSLADFITRVNRKRFDSHRAVDTTPVGTEEQTPTPEIRRRSSTVSAGTNRPCSCPPSGVSSTPPVGKKQQIQTETEEARSQFQQHLDGFNNELAMRPYETLLFLTCAQTISTGSSVGLNSSPYRQLDDYMTAATSLHKLASQRVASASESIESHDTSQSSSCQSKPDGRPATSPKKPEQPVKEEQNSNSQGLRSEVELLRAELAFVRQQLFFERHQRILHAERNRRLYGRLKQATTLEEQNQAQSDQLRLQEEEIRVLLSALTDMRRKSAEQHHEFSAKEFTLTSRLQTLQRENETLRTNLTTSKRSVDELSGENRRLTKDLGSCVQRLFDKETAYAQLHERVSQELPAMHDSVNCLNRQLFISGECNKRLRRRLTEAGEYQQTIEAQNEQIRTLKETAKNETSSYKRLIRQEMAKSDQLAHRVGELEAQLHKRQAQLSDFKLRLEQIDQVHQEQLDACQMKYRALMASSERQETHILELYERLETMAAQQRKSAKNAGSVVGEADDEHSADGMTIPIRNVGTPEIRSYESYHSGTIACSRKGDQFPSSCHSTDHLYLPYLFNSDGQISDTLRPSEAESEEFAALESLG